MLNKEAYAFYEAGAAVAAVHLKLKIKRVSINIARGGTEVGFGREAARHRVTLWLAGLAAERKGVGETDPFRRMKNRERIRDELAAFANGKTGTKGKREKEIRIIHGQAQDRANAVCAAMFPAIKAVAQKLLADEVLGGDEVAAIVERIKKINGVARLRLNGVKKRK